MAQMLPSNSSVRPSYFFANRWTFEEPGSVVAKSAANSRLLFALSTSSGGTALPVSPDGGGADGVLALLAAAIGSGASPHERSTVRRGLPVTACPGSGAWEHTFQLDLSTTPNEPPPTTSASSSTPARLMSLRATSSCFPLTAGIVGAAV